MSGTRISLLADFNQAAQDKRNPLLFGFSDYFHWFPYPNVDTSESNSGVGFEGDAFIVSIPFWVETAAQNGIQPILSKVIVSVVAVKEGEDDFFVETQTLNVGGNTRCGGTQSLNISQNKGYVTYANDPFNTITLQNNKDYNKGTKKGYELSYPLVFRYDFWRSISPTIPGIVNNSSDIQNDNCSVNNSWNNLQKNGWSLVLRCHTEVVGYDNYTTMYEANSSMAVYPINAPATTGPIYSCVQIFYDNDNNVVDGPLIGTQTRCRAIYTPNNNTYKIGAYWGTFFADLVNKGGVNFRRLASTEFPSEINSPFSAPDELLNELKTDGDDIIESDSGDILGADSCISQHSNGNVRIGLFPFGIVVIETIYDDTVLGWGKSNISTIILPRLGFLNTGLETDAGVEIQTDSGITLEAD